MFSAPTFQDKDRKEDDDDDDDDDKGDDEERRRKKKTRTVFSRSQVNYRKRAIGIFTWPNQGIIRQKTSKSFGLKQNTLHQLFMSQFDWMHMKLFLPSFSILCLF